MIPAGRKRNANGKGRQLKTSNIFLGLIVLSVFLFLASFFYQNLSMSMVAVSILITMTYAKLSFSRGMKSVELRAERKMLDKLAFQGKPVSVALEVENLGPSQSFIIEDRLPENAELTQGSNVLKGALERGESAKLRYSIRPLKRGLVEFDEVNVAVNDRSGLFSSEITIPEDSQLVIHTGEESLRRGLVLAKRERLEVTHISHQRWLRTRDFEFQGIRDYVPGDRFRDIHWKSLAKLQKLLTKVYEKETMIPTTILLDCSRSMRLTTTGTAKIDHGVHLSLEVAKILLLGYHPTGIVLFDEIGVIEKLTPSLRKAQFEHILHAIRDVPPHVNEVSAEEETSAPEQEEPSIPEEEPLKAPVETPEAEPFLSTIATFSSKKGVKQTKVGLEGIMRAGIAKGRRKGQLYILISDLEASKDSILRGAALAAANEHQMVLATPFSFWYEHPEGEVMTVPELEGMYSAYASKLEVEKGLKRLGILVVDIGPKDEAIKVTRVIRRKLS